MPFVEHPPGFGPDSLRLLDVALTSLWMERVATGASLSIADAAVCADLLSNVKRLNDLRRLISSAGHDLGYRIKSAEEEFERVCVGASLSLPLDSAVTTGRPSDDCI